MTDWTVCEANRLGSFSPDLSSYRIGAGCPRHRRRFATLEDRMEAKVSLTAAVIDPTCSDTGYIEAFHELLSTLSGALDIRDVFHRLSTVVTGIIPHDEANLALLTDDGVHFRLYASTQEREPQLLCAGEHCALRDPSVPRVFHDGFGSDRGLHSGLRVPVRIDGQLGRRPRPAVASTRRLRVR